MEGRISSLESLIVRFWTVFLWLMAAIVTNCETTEAEHVDEPRREKDEDLRETPCSYWGRISECPKFSSMAAIG